MISNLTGLLFGNGCLSSFVHSSGPQIIVVFMKACKLRLYIKYTNAPQVQL